MNIQAQISRHLLDVIVRAHSSTYRNLQGTVEHLHYHLGQILTLKTLIKAGR